MPATAGTDSNTGSILAFHDVAIELEHQGTKLSTPGEATPGSEGTMFTMTWNVAQ